MLSISSSCSDCSSRKRKPKTRVYKRSLRLEFISAATNILKCTILDEVTSSAASNPATREPGVDDVIPECLASAWGRHGISHAVLVEYDCYSDGRRNTRSKLSHSITGSRSIYFSFHTYISYEGQSIS